uniref:Plasmid stabilization system protein n=1 Tax=uncultured prokaryote TaxID=198431 RepID=A0A0H5QJF2_9ZZZZ|nr:hypothetical protein [uncultured prokaryote]
MISLVKWSDKALSERETIFESNYKISGIQYAKSENSKMKKAIETIKKNNKIGRSDLFPNSYLYILPKRYKVLYRLSTECIFIERLFY